MSITNKNFNLRFFLLLTGSNLAIYSLYHISYLLGYNWFEYIRTYAADIIEFLLIPIVVVIMLEASTARGQRQALTIAILASLSRFSYCIPFYYMEFMKASYPPNSTDSIILALVFTIAIILITFGHLYFIYGIVHLFCKLKSKNQNAYLEKALSSKASLDFSSPTSVVYLVICLCQFVIKLISVVIDTVSFLAEFGGAYTLVEILTLLLDYVICLGLLVLSYLIVCRIKSLIMQKGEK